MSNLEAQRDEILSLESIFFQNHEFVFDSKDPPSGRIIVEVLLTDDVLVRVEYTENRRVQHSIFEVDHLPPIILHFRFPETYPYETCPAFLLSCNWLSLNQISFLCEKLENLWEESKEAILFTWRQFLREETAQLLKINDCLNIYESTRIISDGKNNSKFAFAEKLPSISGGNGNIDQRAVNEFVDAGGLDISQTLMEYDSSKKKAIHDSKVFECSVCFLEMYGSETFEFKVCKHFFCRNCTKTYFESQIKDGNVNLLKCLDRGCDTVATPSEVQELVDVALFEKYDKLQLTASLESMEDIAYCPRKDCQCACIIDACGRMVTCNACNFVFCPFCKMTYHGVEPCNNKSEKKRKLFEKYTNGTNEDKKTLEKIHGKRVLHSLVQDVLSEKWKTSNSKNCPHCHASIEKDEGCNKITCFRCGSYFCWLCHKLIKSNNPYEHYRDSNSECFNQLFPQHMIDEFNAVAEDADLYRNQAPPGAFLNQPAWNPDEIRRVLQQLHPERFEGIPQ